MVLGSKVSRVSSSESKILMVRIREHGSGYRDKGSGLRVKVQGSRVKGQGSRVKGQGSRVYGLEF